MSWIELYHGNILQKPSLKKEATFIKTNITMIIFILQFYILK